MYWWKEITRRQSQSYSTPPHQAECTNTPDDSIVYKMHNIYTHTQTLPKYLLMNLPLSWVKKRLVSGGIFEKEKEESLRD